MNPTPVIIALASGRPTYRGKAAPSGGGSTGRPAWRTSQAVNTVKLIPGNTLASIDPQNNPAINPNYPGAAPWRGITGQTAMISAWGGMAFDPRGRAWMPLQGGHGDYAGNEPYFNDLMQEVANWVMVRKPSGAIGMTPVPSYTDNSTEMFSDGRLRPGHSYNNNVYVPGLGPVVTRTGGAFPDGTHDLQKAFVINETTGEATLLCDYTSLNAGTPYGGALYDAANNRILTSGVGNTNLVAINAATGAGTMAVSWNNFVNGYVKPVSMPSLGLNAFFHAGGSGYPAKFYLRENSALATMFQPAITGTLSAGLLFNGAMGADWDDVGQQFFLWNNDTNTNEITVLKPGANPRTDPWVASVRTFTGVVVTAKAMWGCYGRFGYSAVLGGCYLLNSTTEQFHFFATE